MIRPSLAALTRHRRTRPVRRRAGARHRRHHAATSPAPCCFWRERKGYFKAEGLEVEMTAYASDSDVVQALAAGATDFGSPVSPRRRSTLPAPARSRRSPCRRARSGTYEGNRSIVSNAAYSRGMRKPEQLAAFGGGRSIRSARRLIISSLSSPASRTSNSTSMIAKAAGFAQCHRARASRPTRPMPPFCRRNMRAAC